MPRARTVGMKGEVPALKARVTKLTRELAGLGPVMRGSVVVIGVRNKKQAYFSVKLDGKTRLVYLGAEREKVARTYAENYQRLREIVDEMTLLHMELLKRKGQA